MIQELLRRTFSKTINDAIAVSIISERQSRNQQLESIERFRGLAVAEGLKSLFEDKHFNVCQLDACILAARIIPDGEVMRILRPLHCRNYADMPKELRNEIFTRVLRMFGADEPPL